jgi:hypothetical protein
VSGTVINVSNDFSNLGTNAAIDFDLAYFLSTSPYFDSYDYLLRTENVASLSGGASSTSTWSVDFCNENIPDGEYFIGFYIDNNQDVDELNEVNNLLFWPDKRITLDCNVPTTYTLDLSSSTTPGGSVNGGGTYAAGTNVNIEAIPDVGWEFVNWEENGLSFSTNANETITMNSDRTIVANFGALTSITKVESAEFSIVPNPTQGVFTIEVNNELLGAVCEIYNLNGQVIKSFRLSNLKTATELNEAKGVYFIHITNAEFDINQKLILK